MRRSVEGYSFHLWSHLQFSESGRKAPIVRFSLFKEMWRYDVTVIGDDAQDVNSGRKLRPGYYKDFLGTIGKPMVVPPSHFYTNSKILLIRKRSGVTRTFMVQLTKKPIAAGKCLELGSIRQICRILSTQEVYLRSFSAIRRMVASLTPLGLPK